MTRALLLVLLLTACTNVTLVERVADECGYKWELQNEPIPESAWVYIYTDDVEQHCGGDGRAEACAKQWRGPAPYCEIILPKNTLGAPFCKSDEYYRHHEGLHCKGYTHPGAELKW